MAAQTKTLVPKSRVSSTVALDDAFGFALPTACDEQGRLYVKLVKPGPVGLLLRLSNEGVLEAEFDTTDAIYAVRPNGGVAMVHLDRATRVLDNFGPDGKLESSVRLERPPTAFFPMQIAVFRSGEILISGLQRNPGYKASTAIYDPTGHLVKQLALDGDEEIERAVEVGDDRDTDSPRGYKEAVSRSVAITGEDGFVYLMRATSPATVYVISAAGEVIRKISVSSPTDTGRPDFGIRVVKNRLAVEFNRSCDSPSVWGSCQGTVYTVVDATTGQRLADYEAEKEAAGIMACYAPDPDRFFTFSIPPGRGRLEIVEAAPK
jgi:hypothetical protein